MKRISGVYFLGLCLIIWQMGCTKSIWNQGGQGTGMLKGTISIGPLCPVEKNPPDSACLPTAATYKAYPVYLCNAGGTEKLLLISPDLKGNFSLQADPGSYLLILDLDRHGVGGSNLPMEVAITSGDTTKVEIDIDTGIR